MNTILDYLESGVIDIAPLLSLALNKSRSQLMVSGDYMLNKHEKSQLKTLIKRRKNGTPFAYLSGKKEFYHLNFTITPDVLIPRPETELLIDIALDLFKPSQPCKLLDLGTGSGIIAITLADKNPHWQVVASDYSKKALAVAKQNATMNISFQYGNWFVAVGKQKFDLIISNPPYIEKNDSHLQDLTYEPKNALISGEDGLDDIKIIINNAPNHLNQGGYLLLEHAYNQQARVVKLLANDFCNIQTFRDYNAQDRAILAQRK